MNVSLWDLKLGSVADEIAGRQPAPAGVAAATVAATLGVSLLIKVLEIRGQRPDVRAAAREIAVELRILADADCAAIRTSLKSAEALQIPIHAARCVLRALELCDEAAPSITGLIRADLLAGREILVGAARAILVCAEANLKGTPSAEVAAEISVMRRALSSSQAGKGFRRPGGPPSRARSRFER